MKQTRIYQCEDSIEGIFTAVYLAWASKYGHDFIRLCAVSQNTEVNYELFCEYIQVKTDPELADKVGRSIQKKISSHVYEMIVRAALSDDSDKANTIYHYIVLGFAYGAKVENYLSNQYVSHMFEMNRRVGNNTHYYKEFLRFMELENGVLLAKIEPDCNVTELITPHFADRLPIENFIIMDVNRRIATVHPASGAWFLTYLSDNEFEHLIALSEHKEAYEDLWRAFFNSIAIKERENFALQRNHVALHYRKYMTEFQTKK